MKIIGILECSLVSVNLPVLIILYSQDAVKFAKKDLNIDFLELNWEDVISYVIKEDDLVQCARFIHQARTNGGSVLVHCKQV